ncbi:MAG: pyridoxal phosphate-dependent aminotransferase [Streptococcaceae bacterium]|jgi:alanine-synthesizing transaminase|nr:pyridoxal phosphate-dependent aminotransferase [Streptococcaceae bacterium]
MNNKILKSDKMQHIKYDLKGPVLDEALRMRDRGEKVLRLNTGNPAAFGFKAPENIMEVLRNNLVPSEAYSDSKGLLNARIAIANYCRDLGFPNVDENDIYTGNGVSECIKLAMLALLNTGDEVLVPRPDYPLWTAEVVLAGGTPVYYRCDEQADWMPDLDDIRKNINSNTKGIVLINPNNPTGAVYSKELLEEIVEIARQNDLIIFSDEVYDRLLMDGLKHVPIAPLAPDLLVVTLNGLSKSHLAAGFRSGWLVLSGNKERARNYIEGINCLASMRLCSNVLAQQIIEPALTGHQEVFDMLLPGGRVYEQRETICNALEDIPGLSFVKPKAAFYLFPKLDVKKFNIYDDEKFAFDFLHKHKVMFVHGRSFNWDEPDHFRIVYLPEVDELQKCADSLREFLSTYKQN